MRGYTRIIVYYIMRYIIYIYIINITHLKTGVHLPYQIAAPHEQNGEKNTST